jgi:hypothetical protein
MSNGNGADNFVVPREGDIGKRWYSDTVEGLERALVDAITGWTSDKVYKFPYQDPEDENNYLVKLIPCAIYAGYIPSNLLSANGELDPPSVPSVLVEGILGRAEIGELSRTEMRVSEYEVDVRIVISLWDDAEDFSGYADHRYLKEMLFFNLLKFRLLQGRFEMTRQAEWRNVASGHNDYFISEITLTYKCGVAPDESDDVELEARDRAFLFGNEIDINFDPKPTLPPGVRPF